MSHLIVTFTVLAEVVVINVLEPVVHLELFPRACEETTTVAGAVELVFGIMGSVQFLSVYMFQPISPSHEVLDVSVPSALVSAHASLTTLERANAMAMVVAGNFIL